MSLPQLAVIRPDGPAQRGLPIGDMRGHGRVMADGQLVSLTLERAAGPLRASHPGRPLLSLEMDGEVRWVAAYVPGTNVLETVGHAGGAELRVVDFMAVAEGRAGQPEAVAAGRFVRIVTCTEGEVSFRLACSARLADAGAYDGRANDDWYLACSRQLQAGEDAVGARVHLAAGESVAIILGDAPVQGGPALSAEALHALGDTIHYWTWWSDRCRYKGEDFDSRLRDALALKLNCGAPAPLGELTRSAAEFLALGYRNECAALLAQAFESGPDGGSNGRWSFDDAFRATLDEYVLRYGTLGLSDELRGAAEAKPLLLQCTKRMA